MNRPFISLSTDFGSGNKGIGVMKSVILGICPEALVIDLAHDIEPFDILGGARLFEAVESLMVGCHICVVDPGVGTDRHAIAIETKRGDYLIGPDNGVLLPAASFLGGIVRVHALTNDRYMRLPVSAIFHGRDVFAPAAAHLSNGLSIADFGPLIDSSELHPAPYNEAVYDRGVIRATVIHANHYGNVFLNIRNQELHRLAKTGQTIQLNAGDRTVDLPYRRTFGEVEVGQPVIMDDDFGRIEIAVNQGSFLQILSLKPGDAVELRSNKLTVNS